MILSVKRTFLLATALILALNCPGFARLPKKSIASSTHSVRADINKAQIAGQELKPQTTLADGISSGTMPETSLPVEILAIDNLINLNASAGVNLGSNSGNLLDSAVSAAQTISGIFNEHQAASASVIQNLPVSFGTDSILLGSAASSLPIVSTASKSSEFIDTLYPDPLSPDFPANSTISGSEKNRSAAELIEEFNRNAEEIAARTAAEMGSSAAIIETGSAGKKSSGTDKPAEPVQEPEVPKIQETVKPEQPADKNSLTEVAPGETTDVQASQTTPVTAVIKSAVDAGKGGDTGVEPPQASGKTYKQPGSEPIETVARVDAIASDTETVDEKALPEVVVDENIINEMPATEPVINEQEIVPVAWPDSDEDPEFASGSPRLQPAASSSLSVSQNLFEKADALEPALMTMGKPEDDQSDINENQKLSGTIVPEKHPVGRRKHLYRWVIKTDDGKRIPLKSNIKLLTEVRRESMLDGKVTLNGRFVKSPLNKELHYFVVDSATMGDRAKASDTADIRVKGGVASGSVRLKK